MAPGHRLGDKVEQAYARGDLFQKRRKLMNEWALYCGERCFSSALPNCRDSLDSLSPDGQGTRPPVRISPKDVGRRSADVDCVSRPST